MSMAQAIEIAKSASEMVELSQVLSVLGVVLAALFGVREWRASALEKNWEFSTELEREWNEPEMRQARAAVARYCILHGREGQPTNLNSSLIDIQATRLLDFFENLGFLVKKGAIKKEFGWILFHEMVKMYEPHLNTIVETWRNSGESYDPTYYDQYEFLVKALDAEQLKQTEYLKYLVSSFIPGLNFPDTEEYSLDDEVQVEIRRARLSDLEELLDLERISFLDKVIRFDKETFENWLEVAAASFFVVESVEKEIIAYGLYGEFNQHAKDAEINFEDGVKTSEVISITVHPYYRDLGIGTKLLKMVEDLAYQNDCRRMILEVGKRNLLAIDMYKENGYEIVKELPDYYATTQDAFVMAKMISTDEE